MGTMQRRKRKAKFHTQKSLDVSLAEARDLIAAIFNKGEPLGPEFEAVWDANAAQLYEP